MSVRGEIVLLIILCMLVTQFSKLLPLILSNKIKLSKKIKTWLKFVPVTIISALFFREILLVEEVFLPPEKYHYAVAGAVTLVIGVLTRNIIITVVLGIIFFSLWEIFIA